MGNETFDTTEESLEQFEDLINDDEKLMKYGEKYFKEFDIDCVGQTNEIQIRVTLRNKQNLKDNDTIDQLIGTVDYENKERITPDHFKQFFQRMFDEKIFKLRLDQEREEDLKKKDTKK